MQLAFAFPKRAKSAQQQLHHRWKLVISCMSCIATAPNMTRFGTGFCITGKISDTCFEVFHSGTRTRLVRNVQHLKLAEPVELILDNTSVNILPGRSQLYVRDEHLPAKHKVQLSDLFTKQATETTKPRDNEVLPQLAPPAKVKTRPQLKVVPPPPQPVAKQST